MFMNKDEWWEEREVLLERLQKLVDEKYTLIKFSWEGSIKIGLAIKPLFNGWYFQVKLRNRTLIISEHDVIDQFKSTSLSEISK